MDEQGMDTRRLVLHFALKLEAATTLALRALLRLKQENDSLGHSSKALGFNQRMLLLMDMDILDVKHESNLRWLMEIRNQMVHNVKATSFEACLAFTSFKAHGILKRFPQAKTYPREVQCALAFAKLANETNQAIRDLNFATRIRLQGE